MLPSRSTGVAKRAASSKRAQLDAWLQEHQPPQIGEKERDAIRTCLDPVSESHLRRILREAGWPLSPAVEGVVQTNLEALARTLTALEQEYAAAERSRRQTLRELVITAKQHARWALERPQSVDTAMKEEMLLWMQTWLENPELFSRWLRLRRRSAG